VGVFALLDGGANVVGGVHQLGGKAVNHAAAGALASSGEYPANGERLAAVALDFDGNLIGGTTDAARLDLITGVALRRACSNTSIPARLALFSSSSIVPYRMASATPFLPANISLFTKRDTRRLL